MLAPIVTLLFLTILWVALRIIADLLAESGSCIAAALRGERRERGVVRLATRRVGASRRDRRQRISASGPLLAAA